jgi:hypothetical protein
MAKDNNNQESQSQGLGNVQVAGGINTDVSLVNQPPGSTRFVMTGVDETKEGDLGTISTEESNAPCYQIPVFPRNASGTPYVPLGKVYIGEDNFLLFFGHQSGNSLICELDVNCNLSILVDDYNQAEKLGFSITQQIDATFRLRRGCERTVYWIDPKPRTMVIDKPEDYKDAGLWNISKFNLFKTYKSIPHFQSIEVVDNGGTLAPGSYNFSIRYLDQGFNPTEFVNSSETIMIYNSPLTSDFKEIRGATKEVNDSYLQFPDSNKSIKIVIDPATLDTNYPFYQIAITEANAGGGLISSTKITQEISTRNSTFYYTGTNYESEVSQNEVTMFNNIIEKAQSIEQIENRLILGDLEGKQINYCKLQKYASKICADLITQDIYLNVLDNSNFKDPSLNFNGVGYMPGEIYSFGIVFIFDDNSISPVYHIPGKSPVVTENKIYSLADRVYPMSKKDNSCLDSEYISNPSCVGESYWGLDCEGNALTNTPVRHHRFPLRSQYNIPFVEKQNTTNSPSLTKVIAVKATKTGVLIPTEDANGVPINPGDINFPLSVEITYQDDLTTSTFTEALSLDSYTAGPGEPTTANVQFNFNSPTIYGDIVAVLQIKETLANNTVNTITFTGPTSLSPTGLAVYTSAPSAGSGLVYQLILEVGTSNSSQDIYTGKMYGIKFSNIEKPSLIDTDGKEIIGYYIVRNERKESDRSVVGSAVLTPTIKENNFVGQGLIFPEFLNTSDYDTRIKKDIVGFISPEHKFDGEQYSSFSKIIQQGKFVKDSTQSQYSRSKTNDVAPGSGYVHGKHKSGESDPDGFSIQIKSRDNKTLFTQDTTLDLDTSDLREVFYLDALEDKEMLDNLDKPINVFNLACDNKIGMIALEQDITVPIATSLPYVYLYRDLINPYSNFRLDPYYKESRNPESFTTDTCEIFNGDSYITPIRYTNSIYYDIRMRQRAGKTNAWKFIVAAILVVAAIVVTIFSLGAGTPLIVASAGLAASAAAVGVATSLALSGIKQAAWNKAYNQLYKEGLRKTITDEYLLNDTDPNSLQQRGFQKNPSDDEIQWLGESVNLWFESSVNMGLRHGASDGTPDFLNAPNNFEAGTTYPEWNREYFGINSVGSEDINPTTSLDSHMLKKLTYLDATRRDFKSYFGLAAAEMYLLNPDYKRRNKQKTYNHLALEYDCCSDCTEQFPHRWHWSEQSFQEEITDNFRIFLPNNYKDLEAETGRITDIFRIQNNLYIHTEEGLWHCPQTFQERVTNDVISFIGTGEYFSIPPRKIIDDNNSSAGNRHKWARTKTKYGVLFPSWKEKKWYLFNGENLQPISDNGNSSWFRDSMRFISEENYYNTALQKYPYSNNPSNHIGVGYLSTYDTTKERLIITKKDIILRGLPNSDYEICTQGGTIIYFPNISTVIADRLADDWIYAGIEDCQLKFEKTTIVTTVRTREVTIWVPPVTTEVPMDPACRNVQKIFFYATFEPLPFPNDDITGGTATMTVTDCSGVTHTVIASPSILNSEVSIDGISVGKMFLNTCIPFEESELTPGLFTPIVNIVVTQGVTVTQVVTLGSNECVDVIVTPGYWTTVTEEYETITYDTEYEYELGTVLNTTLYPIINNSWTMSYSLKRQEWRSWHPYLPSFYLHAQERFYSWPQGSTSIWKHNMQGSYRTFYGVTYPFIVEFVDNPAPLTSKTWDYLMFQTDAKQFDITTQEYNDVLNTTFNKVLFYNTEQVSGILNISPKQNQAQNYLLQQTQNTVGIGTIIADRNERDWTLNSMRDVRMNTTVPMFIKDVAQLQSNYYIDKIVNPAAISYTKSWNELESFRDKFLVVRLIFDTFDTNKRLTFYYSALKKEMSER